jgi:prepilin-type N-terminal cleavage/methylation domain-containing protein
MTKRFGFTLAEVLITLGIIGVVAAMTIPTLIANTNGAKFRSQFKKTLSTLNQAGLMSQAQYDFDYAGTSAACGTSAASEDPTSVMSFCSLLNGTLTGQTYIGALSGLTTSSGATYASTVKDSGGTAGAVTGTTIADLVAYTLADGSLVAFPKDATGCTVSLGSVVDNAALTGSLKNCIGFIDVNGATLPNKEINCATGNGLNPDSPCTVANDAAHMTDIFPVVFHDATVEPATSAAKYVLTTSK